MIQSTDLRNDKQFITYLIIKCCTLNIEYAMSSLFIYLNIYLVVSKVLKNLYENKRKVAWSLLHTSGLRNEQNKAKLYRSGPKVLICKVGIHGNLDFENVVQFIYTT